MKVSGLIVSGLAVLGMVGVMWSLGGKQKEDVVVEDVSIDESVADVPVELTRKEALGVKALLMQMARQDERGPNDRPEARGMLRSLYQYEAGEDLIIEMGRELMEWPRGGKMVEYLATEGLELEIRRVEMPKTAKEAGDKVRELTAEFEERFEGEPGRMMPFYREMANRFGAGSPEFDEVMMYWADLEPECWEAWILRADYRQRTMMGKKMSFAVGEMRSEDYLGKPLLLVQVAGEMGDGAAMKLLDVARRYERRGLQVVCLLTPGGQFSLKQKDSLGLIFGKYVAIFVDENHEFLNVHGGKIQPCSYYLNEDGVLLGVSEGADRFDRLVSGFL